MLVKELRKPQYLFVLLFSGLLFPPKHLQAQTTTGAFQIYSTVRSIGVEWDIIGDNNNNSQALVQYRVNGSTTWLDAQPLFRVNFQSYDMLAGSIMFLQEGTEYEVKLEFSDPDGGNETRIDIISTRAIPTFPTSGNTYHVIPGASGGDGSIGNPFQGIATADSMAQPGDTFLLHAGDYGTAGQIILNSSGAENNHIVWRSAGDGDAIIRQIRIYSDYVWFHEMTFMPYDESNAYSIRTGQRGVDPGPVGVVITRNNFSNCLRCMNLNDGGSYWYIVDNTIVGINDPNDGIDLAGEGIELQRTSGHTVAYNSISMVADGISYPLNNVDIYGNDIFDTTDDGIEGDYGHNNIRIWGNRISNARANGLSFQPMNGAPWYILYNQVAAPEQSALKIRDRSDRVLLAHNTLVAMTGVVRSSSSHFLASFQSHNNIWVSINPRYIWENTRGTIGADWRTKWSHDAYDWNGSTYAFKWENQRLTDIPAFQALTGQAGNSIEIDQNTCFETFNIPAPPPTPVPFQYMTLRSTCAAVDAGLALVNINDGYSGTAPDIGAYERGSPLPQYGPRPTSSDLTFADSFE